METVLMVVLVAGASLWAFRQWQAIRQPQGGPTIFIQPGQATPEQWQLLNSPPPKPWLNKYAVLALCALYILCPLDILPDFIPVLGWGDDVTAAVIGLRALFKS